VTAPLAFFIVALAACAGATTALERRVILPVVGLISGAFVLYSKGIAPWELF
jgi:hypothetical protein